MKLRASQERGSAVVEFTLVSVLLVTLFLAIVQIGLVIHVRNTLVASAAEGARYAANANRGPADGADRTRTLLASSLSARLGGDVHVRTTEVGGAPAVEVTVTTTLPVFGLLGVERGLSATAHAIAEPGR
ncbi:TadE family protein [Phytoactinopolyspora limicola]|uniref:TadE family protein n=1 Tax=Phytoactinopolyspora limicola TaxID=2715536 RepID=UPI001A9C7261|nr:TadE/TadG family type IV pilus assembly protein [Phytoactinopolyspora limicola]